MTRLTELKKDAQRLTTALDKFFALEDVSIDHAWWCKYTHMQGEPCDCGLDEALNEVKHALAYVECELKEKY